MREELTGVHLERQRGAQKESSEDKTGLTAKTCIPGQ